MFIEFAELESIRIEASKYCEVACLTQITHKKNTYPLWGISIGNQDPSLPALGIVAGIHGLEKIGTHVCFSFLKNLIARLPWDTLLQEQLKKMRFFFIPLANPAGMHHSTRSNGNGVDLMRNAPITSPEATFLVGGHPYSKHLPWFRGNKSQTENGMEAEAKAVLEFVKKQSEHSQHTIILDLHSGFGVHDQLWFPFAKSKELYAQLPEIYSLTALLERVLPDHVYRIEPQAKHYTTHGDLWDYLIETYEKNKSLNQKVFLPFTLEMGSWNWIKKNPIQLFSFLGPFNPIKPHRQKRILRRHLPLFDFFGRALISPSSWAVLNPEQRVNAQTKAINRWY